ncbi:MAG: peptidylprolyl isomerase [Bacteroidia bacterium]|nr:peptidylprolyl isomerase [Bacteroidia bacterium]
MAAASSQTDDTAWSSKDGLYAKIYTSKGIIVTMLSYDQTPVTVANFVSLSEGTINNTFRKPGKPFYDGLNFHRVEAGFVIQGGDPVGNGSGGPGYAFDNEQNKVLKHNQKGALAMANSGLNTNGSQFYLTLKPTPQLDNGSYTVFGKTVFGLDVISKIAVGDKIDSIRVIRVGDAAKNFDAVKTFGKKNAGWDDKVMAKFPKAKKTASGLYYIIEKQGTGAKAAKNKTVKVHYTGTLWDGKVFDSSTGKDPIEFVLGTGTVIPGWDEGIELMKVGSKIKLIIPSKLAYGAGGSGPIGPNSDLIFDTELISVK